MLAPGNRQSLDAERANAGCGSGKDGGVGGTGRTYDGCVDIADNRDVNRGGQKQEKERGYGRCLVWAYTEWLRRYGY